MVRFPDFLELPYLSKKIKTEKKTSIRNKNSCTVTRMSHRQNTFHRGRPQFNPHPTPVSYFPSIQRREPLVEVVEETPAVERLALSAPITQQQQQQQQQQLSRPKLVCTKDTEEELRFRPCKVEWVTCVYYDRKIKRLSIFIQDHSISTLLQLTEEFGIGLETEKTDNGIGLHAYHPSQIRRLCKLIELCVVIEGEKYETALDAICAEVSPPTASTLPSFTKPPRQQTP